MKLIINENALRISLLIFNFIFAILSIALIALGIVYNNDLWWPRNYINLDFLELSTLIIILGCLSFFCSVGGCFCVKSKNLRFFPWFIGGLFILLVLELGIATIAFLKLDKADGEYNYTVVVMNNQLAHSYVGQTPNIYQIEEHYECCSTNGILEYMDGLYKPKTCCVNEYDENCTLTVSKSKPYTLSGCANAVTDDIKRIAFEVLYYIALISILQAIELLCALTLLIFKKYFVEGLLY